MEIGILHMIVPEVVAARLPIGTALIKLPVTSESSAAKTLENMPHSGNRTRQWFRFDDLLGSL